MDETLELIEEIERLRGLLTRLEWIGWATWSSPDDLVPACPVCTGFRPDHLADCWLAKELR